MTRRITGALLGAIALACVPGSAQAAGTQQQDARCAYLKSAILGRLMQAENPDQGVINGVTTHVLYYFGRLEATMERQAISDLILSEALKFETFDEIVAGEDACDQRMKGTIDFMLAVGDRLSESDR